VSFHQRAKGDWGSMKELIEQIAKALVDKRNEVSLRTIEGEQAKVFELKVASSDLGKIIGKQGRSASSIRAILGAAGMKRKKRSHARDTRILAAQAELTCDHEGKFNRLNWFGDVYLESR